MSWMERQTILIDQDGRITLPQHILEALGVHPEEELLIELTEKGVVLKPKHPTAPITAGIAAMDLPVSDWEQMEQEIEHGRVE